MLAGSPMEDKPEREPKRRTKTGCLTCRKRRVRCDELHPVCSACIRLKLDCIYPTPQPHLPQSLGRPQTQDKPRPGRPRLSASAQSADRPRLGRPRQSVTPSRERRRQTEGGSVVGKTEIEDSNISPGHHEGPSLFPGLVKGPKKRVHAAMSSSVPNTPGSDTPWFFRNSTNGSPVAKEDPDTMRGTYTGNGNLETSSQRLSDLTVRKAEANGRKSHGESAGQESTDFMSIFNASGPNSTWLADKSKRTVTIVAGDQEPFQHFVSTMVRFCQLRNSTEDNLYSYILTSMGLFHECLFKAMMAWSSLHLAHLRSKSMQDAEDRHDLAVQLLQEDARNGTHIDVILATMWFLLEYERLRAGGIDIIRKILDHAADSIEHELGSNESQTSLSRIGPIGSIVLVWMSALDCQAAHFGGAGRILGQLQRYPHITKFIESSAITEDAQMSKDWSPSPSNQSEETKQLQACMKLNLKTIILTGQIILLGRWQANGNGTDSWGPVNVGLEALEKDVEEDKTAAAVEALSIAKGAAWTAAPALSALGYNRLLLLASYYAAIIMYQQYGPQSMQISPNDLSGVTEECAARIIRIALRITREQPNTPPAMMNTLFIAATVINDQVYQAWAVSMFEKVERWGSNMTKARKLLENIIDRQNRSGVRVDFVKAMDETTGYFII